MLKNAAAGGAGMRELRNLLVEGGGRVITSMLVAGVVDRLVASISPKIVGAGIDAVGPLGIGRIADGIRLDRRCVYLAGDDVLVGFDVTPARRFESGART